jgi:hypothetical protein
MEGEAKEKTMAYILIAAIAFVIGYFVGRSGL